MTVLPRAALLSFLLLTACAGEGYGQFYESARPGNRIYVELIGNTGGYSLNYERSLSSETALRIGASASARMKMHLFPITLNWIRSPVAGTDRREVEAGVGVMVTRRADCEMRGIAACAAQNDLFPTFHAGMRQNVKDSPIFFRFGLAVTPGWPGTLSLGLFRDRAFPSISMGAAF